jgi:ssDNA-binding Zn-finger/Zn-ribbon topoisomerase 1
MLRRVGPYGGFLGCSKHPRCKGTRPLPIDETTAQDYVRTLEVALTWIADGKTPRTRYRSAQSAELSGYAKHVLLKHALAV